MAVEPVDVRILERDYRLSCEPSEKAALLAAVARVESEMQAIRAHGKLANQERIAVLAALNIASATGPAPTSSSPDASARDAGTAELVPDAIARRMQSIDALLDSALMDR